MDRAWLASFVAYKIHRFNLLIKYFVVSPRKYMAVCSEILDDILALVQDLLLACKNQSLP